ncbi:tripartite-type tricarboxylate transporter receptor subunit TctC [Rhizobium sp. SLBN-94]|nr:tripartite-type tricarboxylate transporter receptor subunit TctC [Rhizobium sp. SLBN-94]
MEFTKPTRRELLGIGLCAGAALMTTPALAAYPEKPVKWIVGYPPGGATDAIARLLSQPMTKTLAQPLVIDNRPGAGSSVGAVALAASPADGYSIMSADVGTLVINPVVYKSLQYDPERDFRPVGLYAGINFLLAVPVDSPLKSVKDFIESAKSPDEPVAYASPGIGSPLHLAMERLAQEANINLNHVAYKGMAPALNDVLAGSVGSIIIDYTTAGEMLRAGKLRALAIFSEARLDALPEIPTIAEQGFPDFSAVSWHGLIVPKSTPDDVVATLSEALSEALKDQTVRDRYATLGLDMPPSDQDTFVKRWQGDKETLQPLIRSLNIKLDG